MSQLEQLATKSDLKSEISGLEARLVKWMVGSLFVFAGIIIASVGILIQILLSQELFSKLQERGQIPAYNMRGHA